MSKVQARTVLWYLVFMGFAVNYMIRINLNITIVEMITTKRAATPVLKITRAANENNGTATNQLLTHYTAKQNSKFSFEKHLLNLANIPYEDGFHWDEYQQGLVLGAFFWAHWITQIPGGILAKKFGTKIVFGLANVIGCWLCFLIPIAAYLDYRILIWLRLAQGLITGLAWPAMHVLTAKWIPPNERSKFVTAYLGSSVGIALFYPLFGYVMHWASWEWVYHICGVLGTFWWLAWMALVFDSPIQHPRISEQELHYIEKSLVASRQTTGSSSLTPWKSIFMSRPVWMNVIAQWGGIWGLFTLMTQAPTYFRVIHNWNITATGILSGLPHLMRMLFALVFSMFADYLLKSEKMSRTNLRKLATAVCCIVKGLMVLALAYFGHNATAAVVLLTLATMFHGAVSSGPLASIVDIAPNYAGIVLGISGTIGVLPGFISPYVVGVLTLGNQTFESWKNVFLICSAMLIGSGILYVFFTDSTLQSWNGHSTSSDDKELQKLTDHRDEDLKNNKINLSETIEQLSRG
uniref:Major facilitator superfamily (MFS) profile domain-containing protein n=1 Tax=Glossina pallidipes TaxID=7398 RepID=A0A1A9ZV60_GLOPL